MYEVMILMDIKEVFDRINNQCMTNFNKQNEIGKLRRFTSDLLIVYIDDDYDSKISKNSK